MIADTVRNRCRLEQKIVNIFPGCYPEFLLQKDGTLGFRIKDEHGRHRSNIVRIYRVTPNTFTRRSLLRAVEHASHPDEGQPRLPGGAQKEG